MEKYSNRSGQSGRSTNYKKSKNNTDKPVTTKTLSGRRPRKRVDNNNSNSGSTNSNTATNTTRP